MLRYCDHLLIGVLMSLFLMSCDEVGETKTCHSYITAYYEIPSIQVDNEAVDLTDGSYLKISVSPKSPVEKASPFVNRKYYKELCKLNRDNSYEKNRLNTAHNSAMEANAYLDEAISSISIVTQKDFDGTHLAGSSLNDVSHIVSFTIKPHILSNYKNIYEYPSDELSCRFRNMYDFHSTLPDAPIDCRLADLKDGDLELIGLGNPYSELPVSALFGLYIPLTSKEKGYSLRLTVSTETGREYISEISSEEHP